MNRPTDGEQLREYLLGGLSPEKREQIERRMFEDEEFADSLREFEADLLDEFTSGALSEPDRARVAKLTGNGDWPAKLAVSKWIVSQTASAPVSRARRTSSWWIGWAAAFVAVVVAGWVIEQNARLRTAVARPSPAPLFAFLSLTAGNQRGAADQTLAISLTSEVVRVEVPVESGYQAYELTVESAAGSFSIPVERRGETGIGWIPAAMLSSGRYDFLLKGRREASTQLLGTYRVSVDRQ